MKRCSKCGKTKAHSEFHRNKRGDGYQAWCKACRKAYDHDYNLRNHRRWAEKKLAWQQRHYQARRDQQQNQKMEP
jgi:recombinational DNA repair protein (RecF pathway)